MSLSHVKKTRSSRPFQPLDAILYAVIALLFVVLGFVFLWQGEQPLVGFQLTYDGTEVAAYSFQNGLRVLDSNHVQVVSEDEATLTLLFFAESEDAFNQIVINKADKSVSVAQANCSSHADCTLSPLRMGQPVVCVPHRMTILPTGYQPFDDGILPVG